ncbi:MAG: amino acid permease [Clostridia bacterium]|nr:amino acid permease [Clostridia bacterium]
MPGKTKKFRLFDAVLAAVCVVLVVESAAPAAAIGNSQFFWWFFLLIGFFLPYALISAELGTTYEDEGGIYDWVKKAYGPKWGSRVAWYYYINFPLWMGSLAVLFTDLVSFLMGSEMSTFSMIIWQIAFIWIVVLISSFKISDSKWILNIAAIFKAIIMLAIGFLGIYASITKGAANDYSIETFIPGFNLQSLSNISVIIFNFLGFEVVTTFASEMDNPKKQIPKAIILGGIFIAIFYILASFGIGVAVPRDELSASSGLIDSFVMLTGRSTGIVIVIFTLMFIYTLAANLISWSLGVNYVAMYAAKQNGLPKVLEKESKGGMPMGANITNGVIATVIVIVSVFIPSEDIFWSFFALNMITLLLSYILMFPSFLKLRKTDPKKERPFKINGGSFKLKVITYVPMILLILSVLLSLFPLSSDPAELSSKIPLIIGTAAAVIIGEIIAAKAK